MSPEIPPVSLSPVEKLTVLHDVRDFDCGTHSLNFFLQRHALKNQLLDSSQTYVVQRGGRVVGYFTLSFGSVAHEDCPENVRAGMPKYQIPVMVFARLAVHKGEQGKGLGNALVKNALLRIVAAADIAGLRAVIVHAKDEKAKAFYKRYGFEDMPGNPLHVVMSIPDLRVTLAASQTPD